LALNNVPIFYVSGNHDLSHKDVKIFHQELGKKGAIILDDKKQDIKILIFMVLAIILVLPNGKNWGTDFLCFWFTMLSFN